MFISRVPSPRLPIELCEAVFNHLHEIYDKTTLFACSLTCKAFLPACRYRIFRCVSLGPRTSKRFLQTISSTNLPSDPAAYVRHLSLGARPSLNEALPFLATRLLWVTELHIHSLKWGQLDDAARTAIVIGFQNVTNLAIYASKFGTSGQLVQLIRTFPSLTDLEFYGLGILPCPDGSPDSLLPLNLRAIILECSHSMLFYWLLGLESQHAVHSITFQYNIRPEHLQGAGMLLKRLGSNLEHLSLAYRRSAIFLDCLVA